MLVAKRVLVDTVVCEFLVTAGVVVGRGAEEEEMADEATATDEEDKTDEDKGKGRADSTGSLPAPITGTVGATTLGADAAGTEATLRHTFNNRYRRRRRCGLLTMNHRL